MESKCPAGVTVLGWWIIVSSVGALLNSLFWLLVEINELPKRMEVWVLIPLWFVIAPILFLITGISLLRMKQWARKLTLGLSLVSIVFEPIVNFIRHIPLFLIFSILWYGILIVYFTRPKVKEQFK